MLPLVACPGLRLQLIGTLALALGGRAVRFGDNFIIDLQIQILLQLKFSPRRINDFGLSDGEQLERLWSFLRRFSKMTKEMRPSHRIDVLSDAILHYGRHCKDNLGLYYI
jgi:hypothetical protein